MHVSDGDRESPIFFEKQNGFNNKIHWYSTLLTFIYKFTDGFDGLKYVYSVISVIDNSLPAQFEGKFRPKRGGVNCKGRD